MKKFKEGQVIWITAKETVTRSIGLTIGEEISIEDVEELMAIIDESEEINDYDKMYNEFHDLIGDDSYICDSEGYKDVNYYIEDYENDSRN